MTYNLHSQAVKEMDFEKRFIYPLVLSPNSRSSKALGAGGNNLLLGNGDLRGERGNHIAGLIGNDEELGGHHHTENTMLQNMSIHSIASSGGGTIIDEHHLHSQQKLIRSIISSKSILHAVIPKIVTWISITV